MRKRSLLAHWTLALLLATTSTLAMAGSMDLETIRTQQREIRKGATAREGIYARMATDKRDELIVRQDRLFKLLEGKKTSDELGESERLEAFNELEWIEATINQEPDERMVCRREKKLGSNRISQVCRTAAEEAQQREEARKRLLDNDV
jgi:hypothetical protein